METASSTVTLWEFCGTVTARWKGHEDAAPLSHISLRRVETYIPARRSRDRRASSLRPFAVDPSVELTIGNGRTGERRNDIVEIIPRRRAKCSISRQTSRDAF